MVAACRTHGIRGIYGAFSGIFFECWAPCDWGRILCEQPSGVDRSDHRARSHVWLRLLWKFWFIFVPGTGKQTRAVCNAKGSLLTKKSFHFVIPSHWVLDLKCPTVPTFLYPWDSWIFRPFRGARVEIGSCPHQGSPCFKWLQEIPGQLPSGWLGQQCTVVGTGPSSKFPWKDCNHEWDRLRYLDNYYLVRGSLTTVQSVVNVSISYLQIYLHTHTYIYIYIERHANIFTNIYTYMREREREGHR